MQWKGQTTTRAQTNRHSKAGTKRYKNAVEKSNMSQGSHLKIPARDRREEIQEKQVAGLEKYLNSTLPVGQVTLKFCLPGGLLRLPNSLIIHEPTNGSQTTGVF